MRDADAAAAVVEGVALARYVYRIGEDGPDAKLSALGLVATEDAVADAEAGVVRGVIMVKATKLARDLAGTPGGILTATKFGESRRSSWARTPASRSRSSARRSWSSWAAAACSASTSAASSRPR